MRSGFATILLIGTALAATPAHADTLREALAKA